MDRLAREGVCVLLAKGPAPAPPNHSTLPPNTQHTHPSHLSSPPQVPLELLCPNHSTPHPPLPPTHTSPRHQVPFELLGPVYPLLEQHGAVKQEESYDDAAGVGLLVRLEAGRADALRAALADATSGRVLAEPPAVA